MVDRLLWRQEKHIICSAVVVQVKSSGALLLYIWDLLKFEKATDDTKVFVCLMQPMAPQVGLMQKVKLSTYSKYDFTVKRHTSGIVKVKLKQLVCWKAIIIMILLSEYNGKVILSWHLQ